MTQREKAQAAMRARVDVLREALDALRQLPSTEPQEPRLIISPEYYERLAQQLGVENNEDFWKEVSRLFNEEMRQDPDND